MSNELLDHALKYAERGLPVFPVHPNGKQPLGKLVPNGVKNATTDGQKIRDWWGPVPSANIGIATGQVFAVDLDIDEGKNGVESWKSFTAEKEVPETTAVMTPSGGVHLYFRAPDGVTIKNSVSGLGEGVDVRGHGGYVIAPPSSRDDGQYRFRTDTQGIADAPFWLVSEVQKKERETVSTGESVDAPDTISEGERNDTLFRIGCSLRERPGMSEAELRPTLHRINTARCTPPLPDPEVDKIVDSITGRYEQGERIPAYGGDGQAGAEPQHPDSWYEQPPNGQDDSEQEEVTLDDLHIESLPALLSADIRPPEPLVTFDGRSLLHEGTSQLVAKPKIGKTNLAMNLGLAIASESGVALGNAEVQRHGRVLMLNLDGSRKGAYDRFQTMTAEDEPPERFDILHGEFPEVDPSDGEGALKLLREYNERHDGETELIIVDTLQHLRPTSDGRRNVYHEDYDFVHPIAEFGRETDTSILLVHHLNKLENGDELDKVSGSTGLTGAVENVMILDRARGETKATLSVRPREDEEEDFKMEFDGHLLTWVVGDQGYSPSTETRQEIWDFLREVNQSTLGNIAEAVGKSTDNVSKRLTDMKENGAPIKKPQRGVYKLDRGAS